MTTINSSTDVSMAKENFVIASSRFDCIVRLSLIVFAVAICHPSHVDAFQDSSLPTVSQQAAAQAHITDASIRAHVKLLADDLYEGRGPGTRGDELTLRYLVSQYELLGLKPVAPEGGFVQTVPLVGVTTQPPANITFKSADKDLELGNYEDYIVTCGQAIAESNLQDAEVLFAGYGMQAPEYDWDDFKDVDVRGKILLVMNNDPADDPDSFAGTTRLYYGRWDYKYAKAAEMGAAGVLIIHTDESAGYPYQVVQTSWTGEQMALGGVQGGRLPLEGWLSEDAAKRMVAIGGRDLDELRKSAESRDFRPVALDTTVSIDMKCMVREATTGNVLGLLPGSDPELSKEWLIFCAHHDHIGMTEQRDEVTDHIYNGAVDNASGVAIMLSIARAISSLPQSERPKRSILFAAVGAEEQGLLGSQFLSLNPPIHPGYLAAVINIDGMNILGATEDVVVIGKGKSDMDAIIERVARWQKRVPVPDQFPERGFYYRSDQFSLAKIGVPGVFLGSGSSVIGKPDGWGKEKLREWTDKTYHQPSDEYMEEEWDLGGAVQDSRLMYYAGLQAANQQATPAWVPGDEFEATRLDAIKSRDK